MHENLIDAAHPPGMPVAYSYIRMSRPEQLRGDSLRRQLEAARAWAKKRGVVLDEGMRDIGISAYRGKNRTEGALAAFLAMVQDGRIKPGSYLVMESLDRLSREAVIEALPRFMDLVNAGITIVTLLDNGREYSKAALAEDWTPLLLSLAVMARAHEESRTKAKRVKEAWGNKRAKASEAVLTARLPGWLQKVDGRIQEIPDRVEIVRRIFRETIAGDGRRTVVKRLNDGPERVPAFMAGKRGWQPSYIAKLLSNRAVLGEFQPYSRDDKGVRRPTGDPIAGYFPAIVSEKDFHNANGARRSRAAAPGARGDGVHNLFLGLAKCAACGGTMTMLNRGAKGGRTFACVEAARAAECTNTRTWGVAKVEAAVLTEMRRADLRGTDGASDKPTAAVDALQAQLDDASKRRKRLLGLVEDGDDAAIARVKVLKSQIDGLKVALAQARIDVSQDASLPTYREQLDRLRALREALATATGEQLREIRSRLAQMLRETLIRVEFGPDTVTCRIRIERVRFAVGVSQVRHPDGVPIIAIDERPKAPMTEFEMSFYQPELGEREALAAEADWFVEMMESGKARVR